MNALTRIEPTAVISYDDIARMGQVMAQSKLFGIQNEQQAVALMLLCQAENLHPATAMRDYHLIQGRPALKADAMLARFQNAGGQVKWNCYTDERVEATFTHPAGDSITIEWTPQRVAKAQIKNDMHSKYPRQMLKARCISEGIRAIYPGVLSGMYTPEETPEFTGTATELPAAPVTRTEAVKQRLARTIDVTPEPEPEPEPDPIADLILAISESQTREELEAHRAAVAGLKNGLKRRAIEAWKAAEARLTPATNAA